MMARDSDSNRIQVRVTMIRVEPESRFDFPDLLTGHKLAHNHNLQVQVVHLKPRKGRNPRAGQHVLVNYIDRQCCA
jgi:hypothetical protein